MNRIGGTGRDQSDVGNGPGHPCVSLVDDISVLIQLQAAIKVSPGFHRPAAVVLNQAAVKDWLAFFVDRLELNPHIECVNCAAGEEMAHFPGPYHHLYPDGIAAANTGIDLIQRSDYFSGLRSKRLLSAKVD